MADQISIQPPVLDLSLYAGDGISFRLICTNSADPPEPVDLTGAIEAQVRVDRTTDTPPVVEFSSDLTEAAEGIVGLSLTGVQTQELVDHVSTSKGKFTGVWDVQWTAAGLEPRTLCQGKVECLAVSPESDFNITVDTGKMDIVVEDVPDVELTLDLFPGTVELSPGNVDLNVMIASEEIELTIDHQLPNIDLIQESFPDTVVLVSGGPVGPEGPAGPEGAMGPTGLTGPTGAASTIPGPVGPEGPIGPEGPEGDPGPQGVKGDTGNTGPRGVQGIPGAQGPEGDPGPQGVKGDTGTTGSTGPAGSIGPMGPEGPEGPQGDPGPAGVDGLEGPQGIQGPTGPAGAIGPEGPQGDPGPAGDISNAWPIGSIFFSALATNPSALLGFGTWVAFSAGRMPIGFDATHPLFDTALEVGGEGDVVLGLSQIPAHAHYVGLWSGDDSPDHGHHMDFDTGGESADHSHGYEANASAAGASGTTFLAQRQSASGGTAGTRNTYGRSNGHVHDVIGDTWGAGARHKHPINGDSNSQGGGLEHNNLPPYIVVYMWRRTA